MAGEQEEGCFGVAEGHVSDGPTPAPTPGIFLSYSGHWQALSLRLTSLVLAGVCGAGDCADQLHCGHRLPVCSTPHPPNLLSATALLAFLL